eukprot:scaffold83677_cov46-Cyclotella_meneghiniana.AAC.1
MSTMTMTNNSDHHKYGDEASESLPNKRKYESEENEKDSSENSPSSTQKCHRRSIDDDDDDDDDLRPNSGLKDITNRNEIQEDDGLGDATVQKSSGDPQESTDGVSNDDKDEEGVSDDDEDEESYEDFESYSSRYSLHDVARRNEFINGIPQAWSDRLLELNLVRNPFPQLQGCLSKVAQRPSHSETPIWTSAQTILVYGQIASSLPQPSTLVKVGHSLNMSERSTQYEEQVRNRLTALFSEGVLTKANDLALSRLLYDTLDTLLQIKDPTVIHPLLHYLLEFFKAEGYRIGSKRRLISMFIEWALQRLFHTREDIELLAFNTAGEELDLMNKWTVEGLSVVLPQFDVYILYPMTDIFVKYIGSWMPHCSAANHGRKFIFNQMLEFMCKGLPFEDAFAKPPSSSSAKEPYKVQWTNKELHDAYANFDRMITEIIEMDGPACIGVSRNSDIFPKRSQLIKHKLTPHPLTFVVTSHPSHPIHSTYPGMDAPSDDQRMRAASSIDQMRAIFIKILRQDLVSCKFNSASAAYTIQKFTVKNWHLHPMQATLFALCLCITSPTQWKQTIGESNLTCIAEENSMLTRYNYKSNRKEPTVPITKRRHHRRNLMLWNLFSFVSRSVINSASEQNRVLQQILTIEGCLQMCVVMRTYCVGAVNSEVCVLVAVWGRREEVQRTAAKCTPLTQSVPPPILAD